MKFATTRTGSKLHGLVNQWRTVCGHVVFRRSSIRVMLEREFCCRCHWIRPAILFGLSPLEVAYRERAQKNIEQFLMSLR